MSTWLSSWKPWWLDLSSNFVPKLNNIPPLSTLCPKVSPYIINFILDLSFAYAHILRFFNGDIFSKENVSEAFHLLGSICSTVSNNKNVYHYAEQVFDTWRCGDCSSYFSNLVDDLIMIFSCHENIYHILLDLQTMFEIVSKSNQVTTDARKQAKHLERRMVFFISWNRDIPDGYLLAKLKLEECKNEELKMKKELENFNVKKDKIQTTPIEEI
ncbi:hypothetical protein AKO1_002753 [Acrasis kona]|uniref:Uncharacterized protein n=1 Tax=Acrasis kona TaxID=1008807 RepID=A0AAW2YS87_9EUKA